MDAGSKKPEKILTFSKNFKQILENFSKKMKIFENFLSPKSKNFKFYFLAQNVFFNTPGSKLGYFEHFLGQKSQFKNFQFFNIEKIWKLVVSPRKDIRCMFFGACPKNMPPSKSWDWRTNLGDAFARTPSLTNCDKNAQYTLEACFRPDGSARRALPWDFQVW